MIEPAPPPTQPPAVELSPEQDEAMSRILDWLDSPEKQCLSLGGYAGTGKTTVIRHIIEALDQSRSIAVLTPTGKAAHVLKKKGVPAATIHSHIYDVEDGPDHKPHFIMRPIFAVKRDLIIVDEASMVSRPLHRDLLTIAPKILWVGDHGQLEPVGEHAHVMDNPEIRLEKVHRQAESNPVIAFATWVRMGGDPRKFGEDPLDPRLTILRDARQWSMALAMIQQQGAINIAAYHARRCDVNKFYRQKREAVLHEGESVICLRNDKDHMIFNGMTATVERIRFIDQSKIVADLIADDGRLLYAIPMAARQFGEPNNGPQGMQFGDRGLTWWDWAYCITCHKAQGSEWPSVIVHEQSSTLWSMDRWRYTAATRASERLIYLAA